MTESSDSRHLRSYSTSTSPATRRRRRRNCCCICCLSATLIVILVFILVGVILAFTLFRPRDPTTTLISARVTGVAPRVGFPAISVQFNVTLNLAIRVHNPNHAAFAHALGSTELYYRGAMVGEADVEPGRIPPRGDEDLAVVLTVQADKFTSVLTSLVTDVLAGEVGFDATTRIPGRVTFLGFIKHHAVALSQCHVAIGFPDLKVRQQQCTHKTKL